MTGSLPGPDPAELTRYLNGHPDWRKNGTQKGAQIWQNDKAATFIIFAPAVEFAGDEDDLADAALKIARVELGLSGGAFAEAVRRLATLYELAGAGRLGPAASKIVYDVVRGKGNV
jgi:hypothetical protein